MGIVQGVKQGDQRADQGRIEATDFVIRLNSVAGRAGADGIAQQHTAQTESPTVLLQLRGQA